MEPRASVTDRPLPSGRFDRLACALAALMIAGAVATSAHAARAVKSASAQAATRTANSTTNECATIAPFYWEIGDARAAQVSGSVGGSAYAANSPMLLASASKWLYGAYVAQARKDLSTDDFRFLTMSAGYVYFASCASDDTVGTCAVAGSNGVYTPSADGKFFYSGSDMQQHGVIMGLGMMHAADVASAVESALGIKVQYGAPTLASSAYTTPAEYAKFLRKAMSGALQISALLGTNAVCTEPSTCATALYSPGPESWHYSLGHWVEDDPATGDGSFSSPGAYGFYPWISADRALYGIVAHVQADSGWASVQCGRKIRKAWLTGVTQ